jgi:hypothetical protein
VPKNYASWVKAKRRAKRSDSAPDPASENKPA